MLSLSAIFSEIPSPFSFTLSKRVSFGLLHGIGAVLAGVVLYDVYADWMLEGKPLWSTLLENALPLMLALSLPVGAWRLARAERAKEYLSSAAKWAVVGCMGTLVVADLSMGFQLVQREMKPVIFISQVMTAGALAGLLAGCILVEVRRRREQSRWGPEGRDGAPPEEAGALEPVPFRRMRLSKQVALGVLMAVGTGLAGVVLFDVSEKARAIVHQVRPEAEEEEVELKTDLPEDSLRARADEEALEIAFRDLVSNAVKFTGSGGTVALRAHRTNGTVVLVVEDTGIGMDPADVEGLFEAFRQASTGVGREYEGSGLGLTVTRHVVEEMGGTIEVDTEKGEGSRFTIRLPDGESGDG